MPVLLFLKHSLRTKISLIHPHLAETIESKLRQQKQYCDTPASELRVRKYWLRTQVNVQKNEIEECFGPITYLVKVLATSKQVHADHLVQHPVITTTTSNQE